MKKTDILLPISEMSWIAVMELKKCCNGTDWNRRGLVFIEEMKNTCF